MLSQPDEPGVCVSDHGHVRVISLVAAATVCNVRKMMSRWHASPRDEFLEKLRVGILREFFEIDLGHYVLSFEHGIDIGRRANQFDQPALLTPAKAPEFLVGVGL